MRKVYWDKLVLTQNTWWDNIDEEELSVDEKAAVVKSFEIKMDKKPEPVAQRKHVAGMPTIIPVPRSNNISIMLSRFPMSADEIVEAISSGDPEGGLTLERLAVLLQCEPTPEELDLMRSFKGDANTLNPSEKFLLNLAQVERLESKLTSLVYARQFPELLAEAHTGLDAISAACALLRSASDCSTARNAAVSRTCSSACVSRRDSRTFTAAQCIPSSSVTVCLCLAP